jgi:hypothetical protein
MPLTARTPREAFHTLQDHLNSVLNKVLTQYRLRFVVSRGKQDQASLVFFSPQGIPVAVPLRPSSWFLYLGQELKAVPEGKAYALRTLKYEYRVQRTPSLQDEAEVRFEFVSHGLNPSASWSRHHVQFHRAYQDVRDGFSPNKLHIPTGWVTIENVIRFLITDLGVPPLIETWEEELRESEEQFRVWTSREVPE